MEGNFIANLFNNGINADYHPSLQPDGTYRDLKAGELISYGGNNFAIETSKGNSISFAITDNYTPIGWAVFPSYLLTFSCNTTNIVGGHGEIGVVTFDNMGIGAYKPIYNSEKLLFSIQNQIKAIAYPENERIEHGYWVQKNNPPRAINVKDARLYKYYGISDLLIGKRFMVLGGSVTHNGVDYGPNETGSTFLAQSIGYVIKSGSPKVIEEISVDVLSFSPKWFPGSIRYKRTVSGGAVQIGMYSYVFRLVTADGGITPYSAPSQPAHVTKETPEDTIQSYQDYQGHAAGIDSGKSVVVRIDDIDQKYQSLQVVAIRFSGYNIENVPLKIFDGPITGSSMDIIHSGSDGKAFVTFDELIQINVALDGVGDIASIKNYLILEDIKVEPYINFNPSLKATIKPIQYLLPSDVTGSVQDDNRNYLPLVGHKKAKASGVLSGEILANGIYKTTGGVVNYLGINYGDGQVSAVFTGNSTTTYSVVSGNPVVVAIVRIKKFGNTYKEYEILDDWYDHKGALVGSVLRSNIRKDTYRYGLVLKDKYGNPVFAKWLGDITMPAFWDTSAGFTPSLTDITGNTTSIRVLGVEIDNIDLEDIVISLGIPATDLPLYVSEFQVVIARKEDSQKALSAMGILLPVLVEGNNRRPALDPITSSHTDRQRSPNNYIFYAPDLLFEFNAGIISAEDYLENQGYLGRSYTDSFPGNSYADPSSPPIAVDFFEKYYNHIVSPMSQYPSPGDQNKISISSSFVVDAGNSSHAITSSLTYVNQSRLSSLEGIARSAYGSKGYFLSTTYGEGNGNTFPVGYGNFNGVADAPLTLVALKKNISNPYGDHSSGSLANTIYVACGHSQPINLDVYAANGNSWNFSGVQVFGGEAYISIFDLLRCIADTTVKDDWFQHATLFPVETYINPNLREGRHIAKNNNINYPNTVEQFVYESAFSSQEKRVIYNPEPLNFISNTDFPFQFRFSKLKFNGEVIDNFRQFLVNNFRDADGVYGRAVAMDVADDKLFYWQVNARGYLPVNERQVTGSAIGAAVTLGTGGVLDRQDTIDNFYGLQHKWALKKGDRSYVWFDIRRLKFCQMDFNGRMMPDALGLEDFLRNAFYSSRNIDASGQSIFNMDSPVYGFGITTGFDSIFKLFYMTFRQKNFQGESNDFTVIFNENTGKFVSISREYIPGISVSVDPWFIAINGSKNTLKTFHDYKVGDQVTYGSFTYVAYNNFSTSGSLTDPASDTSHWLPVDKISQAWLNKGGDYASFFGVVFNTEFTFVVKVAQEVGFNNLEVYGNVVNADSIIFDTEDYHAEDVGIKDSNKEYRYFNGAWWSSIPLTKAKGRLFGHYMLVKMVINNYLTNPTRSLNKFKRIIKVNTKIEPRQ